jgi:hypothetical protein
MPPGAQSLQLPEVLPTIDPELGALVRQELERHDVRVLTDGDREFEGSTRDTDREGVRSRGR